MTKKTKKKIFEKWKILFIFFLLWNVVVLLLVEDLLNSWDEGEAEICFLFSCLFHNP